MNQEGPWARWEVLQPTHLRSVVGDWAIIWDRSVWGCAGEEIIRGDWKERQMGQLSLRTVAILRLGKRNDIQSVRSFLTWVSPSITDRYHLERTDMCSLKRLMIWTALYLIKAPLKTKSPFLIACSLFHIQARVSSQLAPSFLKLAVTLCSLL